METFLTPEWGSDIRGRGCKVNEGVMLFIEGS